MAKPPLTPSESSWVAGHHYDPATRELTVKTKSGGAYVYEDVSAERYAGLDGSDSPGRYVNDQIKPHHRARKA